MTQAMRATGQYSEHECKDRALQMAVRRHCKDITLAERPPTFIAHPTGTVASSLTPPSISQSSTTDNLSWNKSTSINTSAFNPSESHETRKKIRNSKLPPGAKEIRKTSSQTQQHRVNTKKRNNVKTKALKEATLLYKAERAKMQKGEKYKGAGKIAEAVNENYKTSISGQTIMRYVENGMAGQSPLKMGPDGGVPRDVFKLLLTAFKTVQIKQINGETNCNTTNLLSQRINKTMNNISTTSRLLQRLLRESAIDFKATVSDLVEEQRMRWTTFNNLNCWFDDWEENLVKLGFGMRVPGDNGVLKVHVPDNQKARILNLDETAITLTAANHEEVAGQACLLSMEGFQQLA